MKWGDAAEQLYLGSFVDAIIARVKRSVSAGAIPAVRGSKLLVKRLKLRRPLEGSVDYPACLLSTGAGRFDRSVLLHPLAPKICTQSSFLSIEPGLGIGLVNAM